MDRPLETTDKLRALIVHETLGRLCDLNIEQNEQRIIVHGRTESYYAVQIAIQLCRALVDEGGCRGPIRLNLTVGGRSLVLEVT